MKIKVLHCLGQLNTGGAETLVMNIYRNIDTTQYQFDFLVFNKENGYYDKEVESKGSNIYYLPSLSNSGILRYIKNLVLFFKSHDIDVLHCHMDWLGGFIAYAGHKAGIKKIIVHSHAKQDLFEKNLVYKLLIGISRYLINKYATDLLACSKEAGESLFQRDFTVLFNGIDMKKYVNVDIDKVNTLKMDFNIQDNCKVIGMVGSLSENKNHIFALNLFNEYLKTNKNSKMLIIGDGHLREDLKQKVKEMNLYNHVIFTGVRSDIPEIMHLFDIFLLPSKMEGLGIVAVEAQACGIPCIVSTGVPKLVDMNLGLVTFCDLDIDLWLKVINQKYTSIDRKMLINSQFDVSQTVKNVEKIYNNKGDRRWN